MSNRIFMTASDDELKIKNKTFHNASSTLIISITFWMKPFVYLALPDCYDYAVYSLVKMGL